jgi:hypothetical protein
MASSSIARDISSTNEILPTIIKYENNHNIWQNATSALRWA